MSYRPVNIVKIISQKEVLCLFGMNMTQSFPLHKIRHMAFLPNLKCLGIKTNFPGPVCNQTPTGKMRKNNIIGTSII